MHVVCVRVCLTWILHWTPPSIPLVEVLVSLTDYVAAGFYWSNREIIRFKLGLMRILIGGANN